ncbi:hypothetical protein ACQP25_44345 (plasmid) [Microtetraspora malaysiensis]|uniref:hypothetical protein n=1 Tax=Microtetraspora malaysiensis TaxID=161358 RepID=UPI003D8C7640
MLVNLTPHPVHIYDQAGPDEGTTDHLAPYLRRTIPPAGRMARLATSSTGHREQVEIDGIVIDVEGVQYGSIDGLPEPAEGVWYIVPLVTALAARRPDLLVPHQQVRNEHGTVIGCKTLGLVE